VLVLGDMGLSHAVSSSCCQHVAGPDTTARVVHTNEQGVLSKPPHHERHHRSNQPADPERHPWQAQLCRPGRIRKVKTHTVPFSSTGAPLNALLPVPPNWLDQLCCSTTTMSSDMQFVKVLDLFHQTHAQRCSDERIPAQSLALIGMHTVLRTM